MRKSFPKNLVVFDVDRTFINTTSWYQACITPNLLIKPSDIDIFKMLNDKYFGQKCQREDENVQFRKRTLELIEKKITSGFIDKIGQLQCSKDNILLGEETNAQRLFVAGLYISYNAVEIYTEAVDLIKLLKKFYGDDITFLFLSSGYKPFIAGVVEGILKRSGLEEIPYIVWGSQIEFFRRNITERRYISQRDKTDILKKLDACGYKIRFLADDADDDLELYSQVRKSGGISLHIKHDSYKHSTETWKEFWELITHESIKKILKEGQAVYSIKDKPYLSDFILKLEQDMDKIGIVSISENIFYSSLEKLCGRLKDRHVSSKVKEKIVSFTYKLNGKIYLRGALFYCWLPDFIFADFEPHQTMWQKMMENVQYIFNAMTKDKILGGFTNFSYCEKIILYMIIDHLFEGILSYINFFEITNWNVGQCESRLFDHAQLFHLAQRISDLLIICLLNMPQTESVADEIAKELNKIDFKKIANQSRNFSKMRELDNNVSMLYSAKKILDEIESRLQDFDYIISFSYGGIALGFIFQSLCRITRPAKRYPQLVNCHYSSKKRVRMERIIEDSTFNILNYIPPFYADCKSAFQKGTQKILLYDNNVTTFETLSVCKKSLQSYENEVFAAAVAINYDNISDSILGKYPAEGIADNWRKVLDFSPVEEYITAFNTWGTSEKSKLLENLYFHKEIPINIAMKPEGQIQVRSGFIFKMCRVHNVYDLVSSIRSGANMIGLHAVYLDRKKYYQSEKLYQPIYSEINTELPVASYEVDSIRDMQNYLPANLKVALILEKQTEISNIKDICNLYTLRSNEMYLQFQHRINSQYVQEIKQEVTINVIAAIGIFQEDFIEYFWFLDALLDAKTDYILLDFSKHQPDILTGKGINRDYDKLVLLKELLPKVKGNSVPILVADDIEVGMMKKYIHLLSRSGVRIGGIDMQNSVEFSKREQRYRLIKVNRQVYQIRIRKSSALLDNWGKELESIQKEIV